MKRVLSGTVFTALAIACLVCARPALADSHEEEPKGPILWISYVTAEPGKSNELAMYIAEGGKKVYDGLVEDGHVLSWGVAQAINHFPGDDWTHLEFVNFRDWAAVNEFVKRFMGGMQAMSEEEKMADAARWAELTEHGSHYDMIGQHQHLATTGGKPGYIALSTFGTQPGQGPAEARAMYRKWRAPMMDELMNAGKIVAHGIYTPVMHGPGSWDGVTGWYTMSDLGAVGAVDAAGEAAAAARSEDEGAAWLADMQKTFEMPAEGNHADRILVVTHYGSATAEE